MEGARKRWQVRCTACCARRPSREFVAATAVAQGHEIKNLCFSRMQRGHVASRPAARSAWAEGHARVGVVGVSVSGRSCAGAVVAVRPSRRSTVGSACAPHAQSSAVDRHARHPRAFAGEARFLSRWTRASALLRALPARSSCLVSRHLQVALRAGNAMVRICMSVVTPRRIGVGIGRKPAFGKHPRCPQVRHDWASLRPKGLPELGLLRKLRPHRANTPSLPEWLPAQPLPCFNQLAHDLDGWRFPRDYR